jgi:arginase
MEDLMVVELIGVPFDGMGRSSGQAGAPAALRAAGLEAALAGRATVSSPDVTLPAARAERASESGLLNGVALRTMIQQLDAALRASLAGGRFPLVYGADCSVLLAAVPALRGAVSEPGLVFVDGHEDATPLERSPDGEAANMEIAILLGMTGDRLPEPLRAAVGVVNADAVVMLGPRDDAWRGPIGVGTVADRVSLYGARRVAEQPAHVAGNAVRHLASRVSGWWLHTDLDVLDRREFSACGAPGEVALPGGLTWPQLTDVVRAALDAGGCRGWSLVIYNPDLDRDGHQARRIVRFVRDVAAHLP